jgi:hypothetical protein
LIERLAPACAQIGEELGDVDGIGRFARRVDRELLA